MRVQLIFKVANNVFLLLSILLMSAASSSGQTLVYAKGLRNPLPIGGGVTTRSIKCDNTGNTYITGNFTCVSDFDPGTGEVFLPCTEANDMFIAKYGPDGNLVYAMENFLSVRRNRST